MARDKSRIIADAARRQPVLVAAAAPCASACFLALLLFVAIAPRAPMEKLRVFCPAGPRRSELGLHRSIMASRL
jgi:hypothetical protein